jgi:hypothetical protein
LPAFLQAMPGHPPSATQLVWLDDLAAVQYFREQIVLAPEMVIERALGDLRPGSDFINAHAGVSVAIEQFVGCILIKIRTT